MFFRKKNKSNKESLKPVKKMRGFVGSYAKDIENSYKKSEIGAYTKEEIAESGRYINGEMAKFNKELKIKQANAIFEAGQLIIG